MWPFTAWSNLVVVLLLVHHTAPSSPQTLLVESWFPPLFTRTQFTPSTNNIAPANGLERSFAVFVILLAMGFFSSLLGVGVLEKNEGHGPFNQVWKASISSLEKWKNHQFDSEEKKVQTYLIKASRVFGCLWLFGEDSHLDDHIFQMAGQKPPTSIAYASWAVGPSSPCPWIRYKKQTCRPLMQNSFARGRPSFFLVWAFDMWVQGKWTVHAWNHPFGVPAFDHNGGLNGSMIYVERVFSMQSAWRDQEVLDGTL